VSDPIGAVARQFIGGAGVPLAPGLGQPLGGVDSPARPVPVLRPAESEGTSFAATLTRSLNAVSDDQARASDAIGKYLRGDDIELHAVVAAAEEAQLSLELLVQVRNKFIEAYRTLSNMQG
jgi:flagellar hook-basal body complex protein FliE